MDESGQLDVALVIKDVAPISTAAKHGTKPCKACTSQSGVSSLGYVGCVTRSKDAYMMLWRCRKAEGEMSAEEAAGVCGDVVQLRAAGSRCCRPPWLIAVLSSSTHNALLKPETPLHCQSRQLSVTHQPRPQLRTWQWSICPTYFVGAASRVTLLKGVEA